jgi:hypothetical protein
MENLDDCEELNSIDLMGAIMVDVGHIKGAYRKWYKKK